MPSTYQPPRFRLPAEKLAELRAAIHEVRRIREDLAGLDAQSPGHPVHEAFNAVDSHLCQQHNDHA